MDITFEGKRALVTGAGKGIGRGIVIKLAKCGAQVVAISRTQEDLDSLKQQVPTIEIHALDLTDWQATRTLLQSLRPIDLLVNNAGIIVLTSFLDVTKEELYKLLHMTRDLPECQSLTNTFTHNLQQLWVNFINIRVNCVNPFVTKTELAMEGADWGNPERAKPVLDRIPLRRFNDVEDVVNAVLFLLSDKADMINGTIMPVDGGITATV